MPHALKPPVPGSPNARAAIDHNYIVGESVEYATRGFASARARAARHAELEQIVKTLREPQAAPAAAAREPREGLPQDLPTEKRAVWIVHGMGQQLRFETLDGLASGIIRVATPVPGQPPPPIRLMPGHLPRVSAVKFAASSPGEKDQVAERVELDLEVHDPAQPRTFQLHLYEAYWAPVTEGAAKLSDVISFFFAAGMRGLINAFRSFRRFMFPDQVPPAPEPGLYRFKIRPRTVIELLLTFLVLFSLIAINAVIVGAGAAKAKDALMPAAAAQTTYGIANTMAELVIYWKLLAALAASTAAIALTFGVILFLGEMSRRPNLPKPLRLLISFLAWIGFIVTVFTIIASAALMSLIFMFREVPEFLRRMHVLSVQGVATAFLLAALILALAALVVRGSKRSGGADLRGDPILVTLFVVSFLLHLAVIPALIIACRNDLSLPDWLSSSLWVFPALGAFAKLVRELLVQYPGDVAIYVDSNKVDRFDKIRKEIKQIALDSVTGIYTARNAADTDFEYSKIAVVGHSLGSVIAYDTLNKLLTLDDLAGNPVGVEHRTGLFESFGSPLDKIAYFFTIQGKETFHIREQLAAAVQPLIQSYAHFRNFPWVNVYSRNDIICGALRFFDAPGVLPPLAVQNVVDRDCAVPLIAHVDYWKNDLVWQALLYNVAR